MLLKDLYINKSKLLAKEDFSGLINILKDNDIAAIDNYDRTIAVNCNNDIINDIMNKAILLWVDDNITCPAEFLYNVLPLSNNRFIIQM